MPSEALLRPSRGLLQIGLAGAVTGPQVEPLAGFVQQHQRAHLGLHQDAGLAGDDLEGVVEIERGIDGLADAGERFEKPGLEAELFVEPGVVDDPRRLQRQGLEHFLVGGAEGVLAVRIHVEHAAHLALHFQRHGQFGADFGADQDVARIAGVHPRRGRACRAGDPTGDALADAQLELHGGAAGRPLRLDSQEPGCWG